MATSVLITGANGFIGKNLAVHLSERKDFKVACFTRTQTPSELESLLSKTDFVFHLAGVNRPQDLAEFKAGNVDLTEMLCTAIKKSGRKIPIVYTSSTQALNESPYGKSKKAAEELLESFSQETGAEIHIFRLPGVFGKWAKPNYNTVVATFCHNVARDLPIQINDRNAAIQLVYVDDVIRTFMDILVGKVKGSPLCEVEPVYSTTVGALADMILAFKKSRENLVTEKVGVGLVRALHSTYLTYLPTKDFKYPLQIHSDPRGHFVEMLKTYDSGQFAYFTAHPGVTRGGHFHHTKTEKFLVIRGKAHFRFRNLVDNEYFELFTSGEKPEVVETIPGWTHDITNVGNDELVVMLWANEIFDRERPDTYGCPVKSE